MPSDQFALDKPELHLLHPMTQKWFFRKSFVPRQYADTLASRIWFVNSRTATQTNCTDRCSTYDGPAPKGLYVFHKIADVEGPTKEAARLFEEERNNSTIERYDMPWNRNEFMFTTSDAHADQLNYPRVLEILKQRTPDLARLAESFAACCVDFLGCDAACLEHTNMAIVKYAPDGGIQSHIDNIVRTGHSVGPVFTLSLGAQEEKILDLLPTLDLDGSPLRLVTKTGQTILLDGHARLHWSHSIPRGQNNGDRFTLMIKFQQVPARVVGYSPVLKCDIFGVDYE